MLKKVKTNDNYFTSIRKFDINYLQYKYLFQIFIYPFESDKSTAFPIEHNLSFSCVPNVSLFRAIVGSLDLTVQVNIHIFKFFPYRLSLLDNLNHYLCTYFDKTLQSDSECDVGVFVQKDNDILKVFDGEGQYVIHVSNVELDI